MIRRLLSFVLMLLVACASPAYAAKQQMREVTVGDMMESTVLLEITVNEIVLEKDPKSKDSSRLIEKPRKKEWSGTGFVYSKTDGKAGPVRSRILTASHVVKTPKAGSKYKNELTFFGMKTGVFEDVKIDSVSIIAKTHDGGQCSVKVLQEGPGELPWPKDVATAEVNCDAGRVAQIAKQLPPRGSKVLVIGHPMGLDEIIVTEGYTGIWTTDGMLSLSAPIMGGNSGGPVFHNGQVIGMATRVIAQYHHASLSVPLEELHKAIAATK